MPADRTLRDLLIEAGKTISGLARETGVSRDAIHRWMRGETAPRTDSIAPVAKALGVTPRELEAAARATRAEVEG